MILAIVVLGGLGSQIGVVLAVIFINTVVRTPRARRLPDADRRPRHGADHGLAAARPHLDPAADRASSAAQGRVGRHRRPGPRMSRRQTDPILKVEHLTMRFGGLVAINDAVLRGRARRDHRAHRPERRRQDHASSTASPASTSRPRAGSRWRSSPAAVRRPSRPSTRERRAASAAGSSSSSGCRTTRSPRTRPGRPHLPEHPPLRRHDRAREPDRRPAQPLMVASGLHDRRHSSACRATAAGMRARRSRRPTTGSSGSA